MKLIFLLFNVNAVLQICISSKGGLAKLKNFKSQGIFMPMATFPYFKIENVEIWACLMYFVYAARKRKRTF